MAKISVIIPVYNGETTIKRCLESVTAQTFKDIEIIVVDDGSTDRTAEIVRSIRDRRITLLRQNKNTGQGIARNFGMSQAEGEYFGFVDADDTIDARMYEKMLAVAELSRADMVQCGIRDIYKGQVSERTVDKSVCARISDRGEYARQYVDSGAHTNEVCNKLIRRSFFEECGLKFADTREIFSEDLLLNLQMLSYLRSVYFLSDTLYNYYISDDGHCRSDVVGRIGKMCVLFDTALDECDPVLCRSIETAAARLMILYIEEAMNEDEKYVLYFLRRKDVRRYIRTAMLYRPTVRFTVFAFSVLYLPKKVKKFMLAWFRARNTNFKRQDSGTDG